MVDKIPSNPGGIPPRHFVLDQVSWGHIFDFSLIFRAFRLAIQPTSLLIGLAAIMVIYTCGRALDIVWGPQVLPGTIQQFHSPIPGYYQGMLEQQQSTQREELLTLLENSGQTLSPSETDQLTRSPAACYSKLRAIYEQQFRNTVAGLATDTILSPSDRQRAARRAGQRLLVRMERLRSVVGRGIFDALLHFEVSQFHHFENSILHMLCLSAVYNGYEAGGSGRVSHAITLHVLPSDARQVWNSSSVSGSLANLLTTGPSWLLAGAEPLQKQPTDTSASLWLRRIAYEASVLIFLIVSLCAFAIAGAMICRRSALQLAGKPHDLASLWRFTHEKLRTFLMTPLLPFLTIIFTGAVLALLALPGAIPVVGELYVGLLFWVFLIGGFIIMLMILGLIGGFTLMYPTVAIENSDAFDAISRSFSYVYASPWRVLFYSLLAMGYGVVTNLFLCFALLLMLLGAHTCLSTSVSWLFHAHGWYGGVSKLSAIWPTPTWRHLVQPPNWWAMNWSEFLAAQGVYFWLYLAVSLIGAYMVAYFFCSNVIIYLLLRRHLDGQSLQDIAGVPAVAAASAAETDNDAAAP
ncbi:MAG: hypothetical protein ACP5O7_10180 [Phycisphaerae bacterium]